jgi:single-stranded DNA-specific DHH superfamily exonuclease
MDNPYRSLYCLISKDELKQKRYMEELENLNKQRQRLQEKYLLQIEKSIDLKKKVLIVYDPSLHEGII